ncbi:MAG: NYN domain-containing protein [Paracoccaceae bacterium]
MLIPKAECADPELVVKRIGWMVSNHLDRINEVVSAKNKWSLLYRTFYYDARPYGERGHLPVSRKAVDYQKTNQYEFRTKLFELLRRWPNVAVRLGEVRKAPERSWVLSADAQNALLSGKRTVPELIDDDFAPALTQKGVDMRIGVDIASLSIKRQIDTIVLITGDSDFVPAAKLARREGVRVVLDPLWQNVDDALFEHIDSVYSGIPRKKLLEP